MDFMNFIMEQALIVIPVLWILGMFLKKTPRVPDWTIIWILLAAGVGLTIGILGVTVDALMQGILVAGAAVLVHQLFKQTTTNKVKDELNKIDYNYTDKD